MFVLIYKCGEGEGLMCLSVYSDDYIGENTKQGTWPL